MLNAWSGGVGSDVRGDFVGVLHSGEVGGYGMEKYARKEILFWMGRCCGKGDVLPEAKRYGRAR